MDEKDLPSSSDESDADFVPKEEEGNSDSESEVSDDEKSEEEENEHKGRKRKKKNKKFVKKSKTNENKGEKEDTELTEEKKEIDVDALWADFKKDVNSQKEMKKTADTCETSTLEESVHSKTNLNSVPLNSTHTKQKIGIKLPQAKSGGLSKVLNQIGKKDKMSTLQKSQLDWNKFKKSEGIEEEIKTYNRGKDGYLDKQDFLQRTDMRQFEIEKDLRCARRKF